MIIQLTNEIVTDANLPLNFALKGYPFHSETRQLFERCQQEKVRLIAPPLYEVECDNAIRLLIYRKQLSEEQGQQALEAMDALSIEIIHDPDVRLLARQIADQIGHPRVGDSTYAALAQIRGCQFWTADASFARAAEKLPVVNFVGELENA